MRSHDDYIVRAGVNFLLSYLFIKLNKNIAEDCAISFYLSECGSRLKHLFWKEINSTAESYEQSLITVEKRYKILVSLGTRKRITRNFPRKRIFTTELCG